MSLGSTNQATPSQMLQALVPRHVALCLQLQANSEGLQDEANTAAAEVNIRLVDLPRLSCPGEENLLVRVLKECSDPPHVPFVGRSGSIVCAVTSFVSTESEGCESRIHPQSVLTGREFTELAIVPITVPILKTAIERISKFCSGKEPSSSHKSTLEGLLEYYLQLLECIVPVDNNLEQLSTLWGQIEECDELPKALMGKISDRLADQAKALQYRKKINDAFAWLSKVIISVMDGIHRLTSLRIASTGNFTSSDPELTELLHQYHENKYAADEIKGDLLKMDFYLPDTIDHNELFLLRTISAECQRISSKAKKHGLREFIKGMLDLVHRVAEENGIRRLLDNDDWWKAFTLHKPTAPNDDDKLELSPAGYNSDKISEADEEEFPLFAELVKILTPLFSTDSDSSAESKAIGILTGKSLVASSDIVPARPEHLPDIYLKAWSCYIILKVIKPAFLQLDREHHLTQMEGVSKFRAFAPKTKKGGTGETNLVSHELSKVSDEIWLQLLQTTAPGGKYHFMPMAELKKFQDVTLEQGRSVKSEQRYLHLHAPWTSFMHNLSNVLLWSLTSKQAHQRLTDYFSINNPSVDQLSCDPKSDDYSLCHREDERLHDLVQCILSTVMASQTLWKQCFFTKDNRKSKDRLKLLGNDVQRVFILQYAIDPIVDYFLHLGTNPKFKKYSPPIDEDPASLDIHAILQLPYFADLFKIDDKGMAVLVRTELWDETMDVLENPQLEQYRSPMKSYSQLLNIFTDRWKSYFSGSRVAVLAHSYRFMAMKASNMKTKEAHEVLHSTLTSRFPCLFKDCVDPSITTTRDKNTALKRIQDIHRGPPLSLDPRPPEKDSPTEVLGSLFCTLDRECPKLNIGTILGAMNQPWISEDVWDEPAKDSLYQAESKKLIRYVRINIRKKGGEKIKLTPDELRIKKGHDNKKEKEKKDDKSASKLKKLKRQRKQEDSEDDDPDTLKNLGKKGKTKKKGKRAATKAGAKATLNSDDASNVSVESACFYSNDLYAREAACEPARAPDLYSP